MLEGLRVELEEKVAGCGVEIVVNPSVCGQHSLRVDAAHGMAVAMYLRDVQGFDYCSNVTGIDWPARAVSAKVKALKVVDGEEKEVEETVTSQTAAYLEVVYHLYSMAQKTGPVVLRMRTADREMQVQLPSLTPVWRSAELQEREIFDLYGVVFEGHPDLRRILMWDGYVDHPMRKDYVEPDDYEYEPTAHDEVLRKTKAHYFAEQQDEVTS